MFNQVSEHLLDEVNWHIYFPIMLSYEGALVIPTQEGWHSNQENKSPVPPIEKWEGTLSSGYHNGIQKEGAFILYFTATTCHLQ